MECAASRQLVSRFQQTKNPLRPARNASKAMTATPALRGSRSVLSWLPPGPTGSMKHQNPIPPERRLQGKFPGNCPNTSFRTCGRSRASREGAFNMPPGVHLSVHCGLVDLLQSSTPMNSLRMLCDICALGCTLKPAAAKEQVAGTSTVSSVELCTSPHIQSQLLKSPRRSVCGLFHLEQFLMPLNIDLASGRHLAITSRRATARSDDSTQDNSEAWPLH